MILQLVEQGKIDLDKKILDYLPDYKGEGGPKVSVHQLLNHTSGMKNTDTAKDENFLKYGIGFYHKPYQLKEIVANFCSNPLYKRMERYGRIAGANAVWFHYLDSGLTIIILSNTNLTDLGDYALKIGKSVL